MRLVIIDYGAGNLRSVQKAFQAVGEEAVITSAPEEIRAAPAVVLPGVGAFGRAMENLHALGLVEVLKEVAMAGTPFLGICLGLQLLFDRSEETFGDKDQPEGLGIVSGTVRRFPRGLKVPQIGWNQLEMASPSPLYAGIKDGSFVYFVHSYYVDPADSSIVATWTDYGVRFASSITRENVMAIQFHPEKSSTVGLQILRNFARFAREKRHSLR